jgi:hypothetical protein
VTYKPGDPVPTTGVYWCTVCKLPARHEAGNTFPECENMCGRGRWELKKKEEGSLSE